MHTDPAHRSAVPKPDSSSGSDGATSALLRELASGQTTARWLISRLAQMCHDGVLDGAACQAISRRLCAQLAAQMQVEEELLYPRLRDAVDDTRALDAVEVEHDCLRELLERLADTAADDALFDARVAVLEELFALQLRREVEQVFPLLQCIGDAEARELGERIAARRDALLAHAASETHR